MSKTSQKYLDQLRWITALTSFRTSALLCLSISIVQTSPSLLPLDYSHRSTILITSTSLLEPYSHIAFRQDSIYGKFVNKDYRRESAHVETVFQRLPISVC